MKAPAVCLVLLCMTTTAACGSHHVRRRAAECDALVVALRADALPRVARLSADVPGLRFEPRQFAFTSLHPHGGPLVCRAAVLVPAAWTSPNRDAPHFAAPQGDGGQGSGTFGVAIGSWGGNGDMPTYLREEAARGHLADAVVERETWSDHEYVLVERLGSVHHLLMIVWRPHDRAYIRCEAHLSGPLVRALPALEVACSTARVITWG